MEILSLGLRSLVPYKYIPIQNAFVEFSVDDHNAQLRDAPVTKASKRPSAKNPNFLEHVVVRMRLPED